MSTRLSSHKYLRLDVIQPRTEEWIKKSWAAGKWSPNSVINADGEIIDSRIKSGLKPSPITRDLTWGVPVPASIQESDPALKGKVLCRSIPEVAISWRLITIVRCLGRLGLPALTIIFLILRCASSTLVLDILRLQLVILRNGRSGGSIKKTSNCISSWAKTMSISTRCSFHRIKWVMDDLGPLCTTYQPQVCKLLISVVHKLTSRHIRILELRGRKVFQIEKSRRFRSFSQRNRGAGIGMEVLSPLNQAGDCGLHVLMDRICELLDYT